MSLLNGQELIACIVKELRLLRHDVHGLALLFVMPAAFILVMSLALKDQFEARTAKRLTVAVMDLDQTPLSRKLVDRLRNSEAFAIIEPPTGSTPREKFVLTLDQGYQLAMMGSQPSTGLVSLNVAADVAQQTQMIVVAAVREALGRQGVEELVQTLRNVLQLLNPQQAQSTQSDVTEGMLNVRYAYGAGEQAPSAVQQNVPAWLVFAIFFVVIPVSNSVIRERQLGTLRRLKTTRVGNTTLLLGKLIPYFGINQLQVAIMLLIGMVGVPLLGGDALVRNGSAPALLMISAAVSLAALGYALLIAVIAKTTEQATVIGGAGNIILAAIGGIMVPKFVMPAGMQKLADFSPMSWGLDGFLDVLLRGGNVQSVLPETLKLAALGLVALWLAGILQARASD
ncbi:MAG TPA: ABC transporter permease [Steroidobacteraceae bacterium]|nr:ABC transporter permease [Steroidobacteraceae bacterium]